MASRKPLVLTDEKRITELVPGDVLDGVSGSAEGYIHVQSTASASWDVPHNTASSNLIVQCMEDDGSYLAYTDFTQTDDNNLVISFGSAVTGKAVISPVTEIGSGTSPGVAEGLWTPDELPNLEAWYDAADETTILASGGAVSQWDDKSNNNHNLTAGGGEEPTTSIRTLNGLNTIDFNGVDESMSVAFGKTLSQPNSYFLATKRDSTPGSTMALLDGISSSDRNLVQWGWGGNGLGIYAGGSAVQNYNVNTTEAKLTTVLFDGANSYLGTDGELSPATSDPGSDAITGLSVATNESGSQHFEGYFAEIVVVDGSPTLDDRQRVEGYLAHKWGIDLPGGHPYVSSPPETINPPGGPVGVDTGIELWLDPSDSGTITESGGLVAELADKSGNNNHAVELDSGFRPITGVETINGLNVLRCNEKRMTAPVSVTGTTCTLFMIIEKLESDTGDPAAATLYDSALSNDYDNVNSAIIAWEGTSRTHLFVYRNSVLQVTTPNFGITTPGMWEVVSDGADIYGYKNAVLADSDASSGNWNADFFGINHRWYGSSKSIMGRHNIGEILLYTTALSQTDREKIEGYLAHKWGITLPGGHPYESAPPA
jgi:hypothetical protein